MISRWTILWLVLCFVISGWSGYLAYINPAKFSGVVDLLATTISILIGVSLAIIAVLSSPFSVSKKITEDTEELGRISFLVVKEEEVLANGQLVFFWIYFSALASALVFSWVSSGDDINFDTWFLKALAFVTASIGCFAFLWSARLPLMLQKIASQRRSLG